jgi:hypothetical protein
LSRAEKQRDGLLQNWNGVTIGLLIRHTALHAVGASVPECLRSVSGIQPADQRCVLKLLNSRHIVRH